MTLIEIFIVMTIIGTLSSIAIPILNDHLIKTHRSRAQSDLYQLKIWIEQQYTSNGKYPTQILCSNCDLSKKYSYSIEKGNGNNSAYKIKATPKTSFQKQDSQCYTMIINAASETFNQAEDGKTLNSDQCWI